MSVQTSYSQNIDKGLEGQLADLNPKREVTGIVEEALGIKFGRGVIRGTAGDQVLLPSGSGNTLRGISIHSHVVSNLTQLASATMPDEFAGSLLREGEIYLLPEQATTRDAQAFCRFKEGEQVSTLTFDAELITANTIDMDVDGVAMTQVLFSSSHAITMGLIAVGLVADFPAKILSVAVDGNTLEIIAQAGTNIVIDSIVVAAGASQANGSWAVNRAYDAALTPGRFRIDDGAIASIANTAIAFSATGITYDEVCAADEICKANVNLT